MYDSNMLICVLFVHVNDIKGVATREIAKPLLTHFNPVVGQRKVDYGTFMHTGIQHERKPGDAYTRQIIL